MRNFRFLAAGILALTFAGFFAAPAKAAPVGGAYVEGAENPAIPVSRHCWYRANGRLVCTYSHRPYYAPYCNCPAYRYRYYGFYDRPNYYYPGDYYRPDYYRPNYYYDGPYYVGPFYLRRPYRYGSEFYLDYQYRPGFYEGAPIYW